MLKQSTNFTQAYGIIIFMKTILFQSDKWQKLQQDLGEKTILETGKDYQYLAIVKSTPLGNYIYLPYGPTASNQVKFNEICQDLAKKAKEHQVFFIRIEPQNQELIKYFPKNTYKTKDENPKDTWRLDLTQPEEKIIENFSHGNRNAYNTFKKRGINIEVTKDESGLKHLVALQKVIFEKKNLQAFSESYLKTELAQPFTILYLATYEKPTNPQNENQPKPGEVLGASLFFDYDDTRYYMQSAANNSYKNLPTTVAILTSAIFDAKKKGIKYFDFWGIAPEDAGKDHPWAGFTKFKKSFGGEAVHYAGTYDIVLKPLKYKLYQIIRKIHLLLRHI